MKLLSIIILVLLARLGFSQNLELAYGYLKQGEYDKAAEEYKKLAKDKNFVGLIHFDYVNTLLKLKDYETAEAFVKSQLAREPENMHYQMSMAEVLGNSGKTNESDKAYNNIINASIGNDNKVAQLIASLYSKTKYELAESLILKDREKNKDNSKWDIWLASIYNVQNKKNSLLEEVLRYTVRSGDQNYTKKILQDNFTSEKEIEEVENKLYQKIQENNGLTVFSEILVWWFAQKNDFNRAFIQARALDKRLSQNGFKMYELAVQSYNAKDYKNAARMYQYIMDEYPTSDLYPYARTWMIKSKEELVKNTYPIDNESIIDLINQYKILVDDLGYNEKTAVAMRNMALLQAFHLHDYDAAIKTLENAIVSSGKNDFSDECKLDMGDIYLLKNEPWESTLIYMQVEKSQKEKDLAEKAKLKNAKLQYYTGQFALSKDILDILKKATSKEISNDAMQLSLLIEDNTGMDTSETALRDYSEVDLLIFQNRYAESINQLDSLYKIYKEHTLADEILWLRANTLLKVDRIDEALSDLQKIVENYKEDILTDDALFFLAKVTEENKKDAVKAMEYYRKILSDFPGSIYNAQARIRFRQLRGDYVN